MKANYERPEGYFLTDIQSTVREKETSWFLHETGMSIATDNEVQETRKREFSHSTLDTYRELIHALATHHIDSERLCQIANNISLKT